MFRNGILAAVIVIMLVVLCTLFQMSGLQLTQILVSFKLTLCKLQHLNGNIGAVGRTSVIGVEQVFQ